MKPAEASCGGSFSSMPKNIIVVLLYSLRWEQGFKLRNGEDTQQNQAQSSHKLFDAL